MKMSFSTDIWKYALLVLSILISLNAVGIISIGVLVLGGAGTATGAYIITLIGFLVFGVAGVGCFTAMRESHILSITFLGVAGLSIFCETVFMIAFAAMKKDFIEMTGERVAKLWEQEIVKPDSMFGVQMQYQCCGKDSPQDYLQDDDDVLPPSCCRLKDCSDDYNIFTKGCLASAVKFVDDHSDYLILCLVAGVALEALGITASYYFGKSLQNRSQKNDQIIINE
uniref:Tetraspanin n=1 Tax=Glossina brevipalpis TaxID=37001 RepID=A0A1A9W163_9MUSC